MTLEELARDYNQQAQLLRDMHGKLDELSVTAQSGDRMVAVTVGPRGRVRSIELDPRIYRKLSPSELSQSLMEQIDAATDELSARMRELMAPFAPEGLPYDEMFGEGVGFESFLPDPPNPPSRGHG
ncbi:YbaB/EbfC family nucleoid-associated protein [Streptosporangium sp. NPDC051023]|uniref:YbaB/EbfC family nucleoid-associated protein n=1 Tax=Streptosporangium sp. NPDC051023 TaxID=3155410 RepID=UPI00344B8056